MSNCNGTVYLNSADPLASTITAVPIFVTADGVSIAAVTVTSRKGETVVDRDEGPQVANVDKIPNLRPAFAKDGTVTAASSSSISDGAASLVLVRASVAADRELTPPPRGYRPPS